MTALTPGSVTITASYRGISASASVVLTARQDSAAERPTATFRTGDAPSRSPKRSGTVVSEHDGNLEIDLGSLDGVAQGAEPRAFRGPNNTAKRRSSQGRRGFPRALTRPRRHV